MQTLQMCYISVICVFISNSILINILVICKFKLICCLFGIGKYCVLAKILLKPTNVLMKANEWSCLVIQREVIFTFGH